MLTDQDIRQTAKLAQLTLTDRDLSTMAIELNQVLTWVDEMQQINTDDVPPMAHPLGMTQRLRADEVSESNQRQTYQHNAPAIHEGCYVVPKVID